MTLRDKLQDLDVSGADRVVVAACDEHQEELTTLLDARTADTHDPARTARLMPTIGRTPCCEVHADGQQVGELPADLTAEVHTGLLALAMLDPPYLVTVPLVLERRERDGAAQVAATALVDLDELRLLAG